MVMKKRTVTAFALAAALALVPVSGNFTTMTVSAAEEGDAQKVKDGSFAYFQDKGATDALDALNNSTYANLTVKGDAADATSFENMLQTLQWIRECNRLRAANGLDPLLVNDEMMAMAQADANYSDTVVGHAQQFSVGENCAWNFGSNPFTQWYDEEKAVYDAMENPGWTDETGHYLNIINPSYKTTGFAINTRGTMYPYTYVQVFSFDDSGVTVDEYERQLVEYYNSINSGNDSGSDDNGSTSDNGNSNSSDNGSTSQSGKTESKSSAVAAMRCYQGENRAGS